MTRFTDEREDLIKDNITKEEFPCNSYTKPRIIQRLNTVWKQTQRFEKYNQELTKRCMEYEDKIEELKICNRRLKRRAVAIHDVCTKDCQFARFETVRHGDMRWICRLQDKECKFNELCSFLEGINYENIEEC